MMVFVSALVDPTVSLGRAEPMWMGVDKYIFIGVLVGLSLLMHQTLRDSSLEELFSRMHPILRIIVIVTMMYAVLISMTGEDNAFIYFQF